MRRTILILAVLIACALPALAEDGYTFHIKVTDAKTALQANPQYSQLQMRGGRLERAAKDRVMLLDHTAGAHWTWLMLSWPNTKPTPEQFINSRGGATPTADADLGLTPNDDGTLRTRCAREQCRIRVTTADKKASVVTLKKGETKDLPFDADYEVSFTK